MSSSHRRVVARVWADDAQARGVPVGRRLAVTETTVALSMHESHMGQARSDALKLAGRSETDDPSSEKARITRSARASLVSLNRPPGSGLLDSLGCVSVLDAARHLLHSHGYTWVAAVAAAAEEQTRGGASDKAPVLADMALDDIWAADTDRLLSPRSGGSPSRAEIDRIMAQAIDNAAADWLSIGEPVVSTS